ncbi:MAG: flagellar type III secretion system pore protein FliP [Agathobacter sp.]|nr:flagellar type III secretion system pore protein FliP [Agathobacter sp.]
MNRFKKAYCAASFIFACAIIILTIPLCVRRETVYAASVNTPETNDPQLPSGDDIDDLTQNTEDADGSHLTNNGLSISWDSETGTMSTPIRMLLTLTILSLAPSILIMMTSFTRIVIVLHFVRTAMGTQSAPPNQIIVGLALFLTFFIMWPTFTEINENAIRPLDAGEINQTEFWARAEAPIRKFMIEDCRIQVSDITLFADISGETYETVEELYDVPFTTLVPAFILSELRKAFIMGFLIYIPFIVIDMVVSSVLMSMGMMMLPPTTISMPFKVLLFVLADGWDLVIKGIVETFY